MEDFDYDMDLLIDVLKKQNKEKPALMNENIQSNSLQREIKSFKLLTLKKDIPLKKSKRNSIFKFWSF